MTANAALPPLVNTKPLAYFGMTAFCRMWLRHPLQKEETSELKGDPQKVAILEKSSILSKFRFVIKLVATH